MAPKVTEEHKEQRRREIMDAAIEVFKRKGFEAMTMQDVIEETGMSRGGVYLYFSNKEDLYYTIIDELLEKGLEEMISSVENYENVWDIFEEFFKNVTTGYEHARTSLAPVTFEFFMMGWRDDNRVHLAKDRLKKAVKAFASVMKKGVDRGEFKPLIPIETIANLLITFDDGLVLHALILEEEAAILEQVDAFRSYMKYLLGIQENA